MKLKKIMCEVCEENNRAVLHEHHIIPKRDKRCTNNRGNLACLCSNCHNLVHAGEIIIIGVYGSTEGKKLMWFRLGEEPPLPKEYWLIKDNPLVILR